MEGQRESSMPSTITDCLLGLEELEKCYSSQKVLTLQFKEFLRSLECCIYSIHPSVRQNCLTSSSLHRKMLLCLSQIAKILKLFGDLLVRPPHRQSVWYLSERLRWCVSQLGRMSVSAEEAVCDDSGGFLTRMDLALQLLDSEEPLPPTYNQLVDDIIYQAVTIAKIASSMDYSEITVTCHKVLEEINQLTSDEIKNLNEINLLRSSLSVSLQNLELRVNTALLRLFLEVFVEPHAALKHLVHACGDAKFPRDCEDLDGLVDQLDSHVERILLIGQFAVTCCEDRRVVSKIRCSLASLESIDNYLVPAVRGFYLSPSEPARDFVRFLSNHWQDELTELQASLDVVIDSYAFSRVVSETISDQIDKIRKDNKEADTVGVIVKEGWFFYKHLSKSLDHTSISQLKQAVHEYEAAVVKKASLSSIVKRANRLISTIDSVSDQMSSAKSIQNESSEMESSLQAINKIAVPEPVHQEQSIQDIPLDISIKSSSRSQYNSYRPHWLQKKLTEEREKLQELHSNTIVSSANTPEIIRSSVPPSVFQTPKNEMKLNVDLLTPYLSQKKERNTTLYVQTPRKVMQSRILDHTLSSETSVNAVKDCNSLVLDITDILENLSVFASTLSSVGGEDLSSPPSRSGAEPARNSHSGWSDLESVSSKSCLPSEFNSLASVRTDQVSADIHTPERMQDLQYLDQRIQQLKML